MPTLTYPGYYPLTGTASGAQLHDLFYDPSSPNASLAMLNGRLDGGNFTTTFELEQLHTQRGSVVTAFGSSANANIDYRAQVFGGFEFGATDPFEFPTLAGEQKFYIPGGNVTAFFPYETTILLVMFTVYWNAHTPDADNMSSIFLHVDGTVVQDMARNVSNTAPLTGTEVDNYSTNYGYKKARAFHGHFVSPATSPLGANLLSGGWHTVGLGIMADPGVKMTRIHARDIVVMAFKSSGS